jgi:hypothetical protein
MRGQVYFAGLIFALLIPGIALSQDFREFEKFTAKSKKKIEAEGKNGSQFWLRLDSSKRPHRLYVGRGFYEADLEAKKEFVETFSRYLAGHPEKFMLVDLYDATTGAPIGELGWGGFKLYPSDGRAPKAK